MPIIIIDKKDINRHPDLKEQLQLIAKDVEESDVILVYKTAPEKINDFLGKLRTRHIAFYLKQS